MEQQLLTKEKIQEFEQLAQVQLDAVEETTSPWDAPIFVIKKVISKIVNIN